MPKVSTDKRINKFLYSLPRSDRAKIQHLIELFGEKGFSLSANYLKKISKNIWELRPGRVRLLLGIVENEGIIVNAFIKKTMKTPMREIELAEDRLRGYQ